MVAGSNPAGVAKTLWSSANLANRTHLNLPELNENAGTVVTPKGEAMPSYEHTEVVRRIVRHQPGARTRGFGKALLKEVFPEPEMYGQIGVVPDAYIIDKERDTIIVYEVQTTNRLDAYKLSVYRDLWWALDNIEWNLVLIVHDTRDGKAIVTDMGDAALSAAAIEASVPA